MSHPIDDRMPGPRHQHTKGVPLNIYIHAVGPRNKSGRGQHGFGVVVTGQYGLQLCEFGYKSTSPQTTKMRGQLGALLSAMIWRERFAPEEMLTVKTRLKYIYDDFANNSDKWISTGKKSDGKPPENFDLIKLLHTRWSADKDNIRIVRVPIEEEKLTGIAEEIARSMRDHGSIEPLVKPGSVDDFVVIEEDIHELIERALYKDNRREERMAGYS